MPINRIINRAIEANAIVNDKFANNSITVAKIPDGSITLNKLANTAISSISSLRITTIQTPSGIGFTDLNTTETITITGSGFQSGVKIFFDEIEITQANINYVDSTTVTFPAPALVPDVYHLWMFNPDGGSTVKPLGIQYVSPPVWETFSIPSASQYNYYSATVSAISQETLSYSLVGVLPTGISLSPKGKISGYPIATVGSYFIGITTKTASGIENTRYFTFDLSAGSFTANVDVLTVAGGGGGAMGGGGAGGFRIASNLIIPSTGNVSVIVGGGGGFSYQNSFNNLDQPGYNSQIRGGYGSSSSFSANGVVLLQSSGGGGGGAGFSSIAWANPGGSGGGGGLSAGAAFLQIGLVQIGSGGSGNTGSYTPVEGYAGGNGGYNTNITAANFNASVYGLPFEKAGGGGGGAGGPGSTVVSAAASPTGGAGGPAIFSTFTGANVAYAGGGGGGGGIAGGAGGGAGAGSGAGGGGSGSGSGGDALPNTGSGGGGMKYGSPMNSNDTPAGTVTVRSGTGGSGIVIAKLYPTFGFFTGGNLLNQTGGVSVYEFKNSNIFVISSNLTILSNTIVTWETTSLNGTIRGSNYYAIFRAQSQLKLFYQLNSGSFPDGLTFNGQTGELIGIVSANAVTSSFTIKAINVAGASALANFTINVQTTAINLEYLVIGGGGSQYNPPGERRGGGGGAGGVLSSTISVTGGQVISVIVGAGGVRSNGGNSTIQSTGISSITAIGGGMGGAQGTAVSPNGSAGQFGGSGGGGGGAWFNGTTSGTVGPGGTAASGQGSAGGSGSTWTTIGGGESGGGGGAGGGGGTGVVPLGGAATGSYSAWAIDTSTGVLNSYAGGGGGGPTYRNSDAFSGLIAAGGGGGAGDASTNAVANTGSGGLQGGSGLVLIRYPGNPLNIGGNIKVVSGYTYHIFRTSGNLFVGSAGPIWVSPGSLSEGLYNGTSFSTSLVVDGLYPPFSYSIISGSLPPGLALNSSTGVISGTINTIYSQEYVFTIRVRDTINSFSDRVFTIPVNGYYVDFLVIGGGGGFGGGDGQNTGGDGGAAAATTGTFFARSDIVYTIIVGTGASGSGRGFIGSPGLPGGGNGGGILSGFDGAAGSGGGYSGINVAGTFLTIAGGGGGAWSRNWTTRQVNGSGGGPATGFGATVCSSYDGVNGPTMSGGGGGGFCGGSSGVGGGSYVNINFVTNGQAFTSSNSAWAPPTITFTGYDSTLNKGRAGYWYVWNATTESQNGIVVLRYQGSQRGIGGSVSTVSGYTVHTFTANSSYSP